MHRTTWLIGLAALLTVAGQVWGQGLIIDRRPEIPVNHFYRVQSVEVDGTIRDQVAEIQVSQSFHNPGRREIEAEFLFPLPEDGAIQNFTLLVDGKELPGKLLTKEEARRIYDSIVRSKKDPALLEYIGRGLLKTSIFPIPAGKTRTITLRYTQLCKQDSGVVRFDYPLSTHKHADKSIEKLSIDLRLISNEPIKSVYSPSHNVEVKRRSRGEARVSFSAHGAQPRDDFRLMYDLANEQVGATVLSYRPDDKQDGFFLLLASPGFSSPDEKPAAKTVICVLDKSGSMSGKKIEQARKALEFVLRNLNDDDTFNIITYNDAIDSYKPELERYDKRSRDQALNYVEGIRAGGSTNIDSALDTAMNMIHDSSRPIYVLFLTDGLPTAGERNELNIAKNCKKANDYNARLIAFGVGNDVNARLLDRLTAENGGVTEYVKPDEDIEAAVSRFYGRIASPVMSNIDIAIDGTKTNRMYPGTMPDLFEGQQCVVVGRYAESGKAKVRISGKVGSEKQTFNYKTVLADDSNGSAYAFVEKLWAQRRVGYIIDEIDLHGKNSELIAELVELSQKHGILTPYTSFLADETTNLAAVGENIRTTTDNAVALEENTSGSYANAQRTAKSSYKYSAQAGSGPAPATTIVAKDEAGMRKEKSRVQNVQNIANRSFFKRGDTWVQSNLSQTQQDNAINIKQFSDEYYDLVARVGRDNQYLAPFDNVYVELEGKVYNVRR